MLFLAVIAGDHQLIPARTDTDGNPYPGVPAAPILGVSLTGVTAAVDAAVTALNTAAAH